MLVGNLQANGRLAGNHLDHAHRNRRQRTRQVFGQVGHLAGLGAGRQLQLEQRHHRPRVHRHHLGGHAKVGQLALHLAGHRLQGFRRQHVPAGLGRIEQAQRRQLGVRLRLQQGHLFFFLDPHAGLGDRLGGFDHRRGLVGLGLNALLFLAQQLLTLLLHLARLAALLQAVEQVDGLTPGIQRKTAQAVHHRQPGNAGEQGKTDQEGGQHQQAGAVGAQGHHAQLAHGLSKYAAGALGQARAT